MSETTCLQQHVRHVKPTIITVTCRYLVLFIRLLKLRYESCEEVNNQTESTLIFCDILKCILRAQLDRNKRLSLSLPSWAVSRTYGLHTFLPLWFPLWFPLRSDTLTVQMVEARTASSLTRSIRPSIHLSVWRMTLAAAPDKSLCRDSADLNMKSSSAASQASASQSTHYSVSLMITYAECIKLYFILYVRNKTGGRTWRNRDVYSH